MLRMTEKEDALQTNIHAGYGAVIFKIKMRVF